MPYIVPHSCICGGGESGALIDTVQLKNDGHLIVTYEDGVSVDTGALLTQTQLDNLNNVIAPAQLGNGLSLDEDGKLQLTMQMKIGDDTIDIQDGVFTLPIASEDSPGLVKLSDDFEFNEDGQLTLNEVNIQKLIVDDDTELIIGG